MTVSALVLAGSRGAECPVARDAGVSHKALAPLEGRPMIAWVVDALMASQRIDRILVLIEDPDLILSLAELRPLIKAGTLAVDLAKPSPSLSALHGMDQLGGETRPVLMTTADNPLLTPQMISHFLDHSPREADAVAALAQSALVLNAHPGAVRTILKFSDAGRSGCNLFLFRSPRAQEVLRFWRRVETNRKNPLKILHQIGALVAMRYASGTLSLEDALAALGKRTGTQLAAVDMPFAEAAIDVDKSADMILAKAILANRNKTSVGDC